MQGFFEAHVSDIYLVHGSAFLVLGGVAAVLPRKDSTLPFARDFWLIAAYGVLHGIYQLLLMRNIVFLGDEALPPWQPAACLLISFLPLFEFGRRLMPAAAQPVPSPRAAAIPRALLAYGAAGAAIVALALWCADPAVGLAAGARYFLGFPGALLSGVGLLLSLRRTPRQSLPDPVRGAVWITALSAIGYGLLIPVLVQGDPHLPAWLPTAGHFGAAVGIPAAWVRAMVAVALMGGLIRLAYGANVGLRQVEERLRESTAQLLEAQEMGRFGRWEFDLVTNRAHWTPEMYDIFAIDPLTGADPSRAAILERVHPDDRAAWEQEHERSIVGQGAPLRFRLLLPDGTVRHLDTRRRVLKDAFGRIRKIYGVVQDITEQVRAEQALRETQLRQQSILDSMFAFVGLFGLDGTVIDVNRAPLMVGGVRREDVIGKPFCDTYWLSHSSATREQIRAALGRAALGETVRDDFMVRVAGGAFVTIDATFSPLQDGSGRVVQIVGSGVDITGRKRAEEALRESESRLADAQRIAHVGSWELDLANNVLVWSDEIFRIFEIDRERFGATYEAFLAAIHPDDRERVNAAYTRSLETREPYEITHRLRVADGRIKHVHELCETYFDVQGKPLRSVGTIQDITARVTAEEALRETETRLRETIDALPAAFLLYDAEERLVLWNRYVSELFPAIYPQLRVGMKYEEATRLTEPHFPGTPEERESVIQQRIARFRAGTGTSLVALNTGRTVQFANFRADSGSTICLRFDVTEDQRKEAELQRQREFSQSLVALAPVIILVLDMAGKIQHINPYLEQLSGYRLEEVRGGDWFDTFLPARDRGRIRALFQTACHGDPIRGNVNPIVTRAGAEREVEWSDSPMRNERGEIVAILAVGQDVTERRRLGLELEEQRRLVQTILDTVPDWLFLKDRENRYRLVNRAMAEFFGHAPDWFVGKAYPDFAFGEAEEIAIIHDADREILHEGQETVTRELRVRRGDGQHQFRHLTKLAWHNGGGRLTGVVGVSRDITAHKQAELALRESERNLAEAQRIAHLGSWQREISTNSLYWSDEVYRIFGLVPGDAQPSLELVLSMTHPEDRDHVLAAVNEAGGAVGVYSYEHRIVRPDGAVRTLLEQAEAIRDDMGRKVRTQGVVLDVTERRQAEAGLLASQRRMQAVLGSISDGFFTLNTEWIYTYVNERAARLVGKTPQELLNRRIWDVFPDAEGSSWHQRYRQVMESKQPVQFQDYYPHLDAWYEGAVYPFEDGISIYFHEVTEQKQAADRIVAQLQEKEVLLREIHHRVKNNLQIVSSLLYLQQQQSPNPENAEVLRESRNRVAAMALVHEKLYSSTDLSHVDLLDYARDLALSLFTSFGADPERIRLRVEGDRFALPLDRAISCGLLLNEIVSNSLKHAFPGGRGGEISIAATARADGYELIFQDDGIGHGIVDLEQPRTSLGLRLIPRLTSQLGGTIDRMNGAGTGYRLRIPREERA